jgi:hypothetical protein
MQPYVLALSARADGSGKLELLEGFTNNPAGAAIVSTVGPIRQIVQGTVDVPRRYLVIASGSMTRPNPYRCRHSDQPDVRRSTHNNGRRQDNHCSERVRRKK